MIHTLAIIILKHEIALKVRQAAELQDARHNTVAEHQTNIFRARKRDEAAEELRKTVEFLEAVEKMNEPDTSVEPPPFDVVTNHPPTQESNHARKPQVALYCVWGYLPPHRGGIVKAQRCFVRLQR